MMEKHFVTFYSPGTFVAEGTTKEVPAWDIDLAVAMSADIRERHSARPYGFQFTTRAREEHELDSRIVRTSGMHYLGGKVETVDEVRARGLDSERILLANMEGNGWPRIWRSTVGWQWTQPLRDEDVVIDA